MWDVTTIIVFSFLHTKISTHTSRVGCDELVTAICLSKWRISTHTSRVGCDVGDARCSVLRCRFLLTHPVWDVTRDWSSLELQHSISTHTSRVGCDSAGIPLGSPGYIFLLTHPVWDVTPFLYIISINPINFYSHIPCGMWPSSRIFSIASPTISTHTSRVGCDLHCQTCITCSYISTHTSRVGCDAIPYASSKVFCYFYSHIPCGMWQQSAYCADVW